MWNQQCRRTLCSVPMPSTRRIAAAVASDARCPPPARALHRPPLSLAPAPAAPQPVRPTASAAGWMHEIGSGMLLSGAVHERLLGTTRRGIPKHTHIVVLGARRGLESPRRLRKLVGHALSSLPAEQLLHHEPGGSRQRRLPLRKLSYALRCRPTALGGSEAVRVCKARVCYHTRPYLTIWVTCCA